MKRRLELQIHREDHKTDALGRIFLEASQREETLRLIGQYLGPHTSLKHVELDDALLRVEVDVREFPVESRNLVEMARDMARRGLFKAAVGQLEEALRLSPLNPDALKALGRLHYRHRQPDLARQFLTRAREITPHDLEVLRLLAEIALHDDRRLAALAYLEQVLRVRPNDRRARAAMARIQPVDEGRVVGAVATARRSTDRRAN